jgi:hypothetical protein
VSPPGNSQLQCTHLLRGYRQSCDLWSACAAPTSPPSARSYGWVLPGLPLSNSSVSCGFLKRAGRTMRPAPHRGPDGPGPPWPPPGPPVTHQCSGGFLLAPGCFPPSPAPPVIGVHFHTFFIHYRHTTRRQEGTGNQLYSALPD